MSGPRRLAVRVNRNCMYCLAMRCLAEGVSRIRDQLPTARASRSSAISPDRSFWPGTRPWLRKRVHQVLARPVDHEVEVAANSPPISREHRDVAAHVGLWLPTRQAETFHIGEDQRCGMGRRTCALSEEVVEHEHSGCCRTCLHQRLALPHRRCTQPRLRTSKIRHA